MNMGRTPHKSRCRAVLSGGLQKGAERILANVFSDFKNTIVNNPSFTVKEQLGYAGGIFGNTMGQDCVGTFSDQFVRTYMGVEGNKKTLMDNITKILGFIVPPLAGNFLDKPPVPGKKSATKLFTGIMPIPFAIASMLLFVVPSSNAMTNFVWTLIFKMLFDTADTFYDISLNTLSLRMTNNANDRKNFYTASTLAGALGSMLPGWLIPIFVGSAKDAVSEQRNYFIPALIFCILGVSGMYAPFFTLNEKITVDASKSKEKAVHWDRDTVIALLHNRTFIVCQIAIFFERIRSRSYELLNYIYKNVLDAFAMKTGVDVISGVLSYMGLFAVPFLGKRFSARTILSGGFGYTGIFYTLMGLLGLKFNKDSLRRKKWILGIMIGLAGMPNQAISTSKKILIADSTDYMEWYSEKNFGKPIHADGLICSSQSILNKIFDFVATNIYNIFFTKTGFKSNVTDPVTGKQITTVQSDDTLKKIYTMFVLFGIIGNFLASATYLFDNFTGKKKDSIMAELKEMRAVRANAAGVENISD